MPRVCACQWTKGACSESWGLKIRILKQLYKPEARLTEWSQALWSPSLLFSSVGPATSWCLETLSAGRGTPQQGPAQSWKPPPGSLLLWANASRWELSFIFCPSHHGLSGCLCLLEKMNAGICMLCLWLPPLPHSFQKPFVYSFLRQCLASVQLMNYSDPPASVSWGDSNCSPWSCWFLRLPRALTPQSLRSFGFQSPHTLTLGLFSDFVSANRCPWRTETPSCCSCTSTHSILFLRHT